MKRSQHRRTQATNKVHTSIRQQSTKPQDAVHGRCASHNGLSVISNIAPWENEREQRMFQKGTKA
jgi:hypothetical protein